MLIFILTICIIFSGCVEENNATQSNESVNLTSVNIKPGTQSSTTLSSEENIPEIEVTSFSSIYMHDNSKSVLSYLFSWDNVPGNESKKLSDYLKNDLEIDWVSNAKIIKTDDNNTIRVFTSDNSLELKLADDKNMVSITPNNIQLKVKEKDSKLCIYKVEEYYGGVDPEENKLGYNLNERYYAVYGLSIKNNGSKNLDFKLNKLHVRDGGHIFNTTTLDPYGFYVGSRLEVLSTFEKGNKFENTTLFPGQAINGSVVFQVNSLYNESFLLMYNETPISSASFEKSIKALRTAERYNYSVAFGILPYHNGDLESFEEPDLMQYPYIYSNWINRSVFEYFNKADSESVLRSSPNDLNFTIIVYALKVIPERNITILSGKTRFVVVDDTGEELINPSDFYGDEKIAILGNKNYKLYSRENMDIPQMNLSNATIVRTSFERYGNMDVGIICFNNQDVIMDDSQNITIARSSNLGFHFP